MPPIPMMGGGPDLSNPYAKYSARKINDLSDRLEGEDEKQLFESRFARLQNRFKLKELALLRIAASHAKCPFPDQFAERAAQADRQIFR